MLEESESPFRTQALGLSLKLATPNLKLSTLSFKL
jgi:hypothetical protein